MEWATLEWATVQQALGTLRPVKGGFSNARRGIVTLPNGSTAFVKLATDARTAAWIDVEKKAYRWLEEMGYRHAPRLLSQGEDGFALADLSSCDWSHTWDDTKVDAMLTALDDLARVPTIGTDFAPITFRENPWNELPDDAQPYRAFLSAEPLQAVTALLQDGALRHQYSAVAAAEPWRGDRLVHYDVRSDNFAYDRLAGVGYLVDWDWIGLGNEAFDRTGLLVNVQLAGYDVLATHCERLDKASLIWLLGFWLKSAVGPRDTEGLRQLRPQQVLSALEAYRLIQRLS